MVNLKGCDIRANGLTNRFLIFFFFENIGMHWKLNSKFKAECILKFQF